MRTLSKGCAHANPHPPERAVASSTEVSGHLVGSAAFKAVETSDPRLAGSIPVHLRHFEVVGEIKLAGGPSLWPMWRAPR